MSRVRNEESSSSSSSLRGSTRQLLAVVKLDVGEGSAQEIRVFYGDDVIQLVQDFCRLHDLEDKCVAHMVKHITQQINTAQSKQIPHPPAPPIQSKQWQFQSQQSSEKEDMQSQSSTNASSSAFKNNTIFQFNNHHHPMSSSSSSSGEQLRSRQDSETRMQENYEKWHKYIGLKSSIQNAQRTETNQSKKYQQQQQLTSTTSPSVSMRSSSNLNVKSSFVDEQEEQLVQRIRDDDLLPKTVAHSPAAIGLGMKSSSSTAVAFRPKKSREQLQLSGIEEVHNSSASNNTSRVEYNSTISPSPRNRGSNFLIQGERTAAQSKQYAGNRHAETAATAIPRLDLRSVGISSKSPLRRGAESSRVETMVHSRLDERRVGDTLKASTGYQSERRTNTETSSAINYRTAHEKKQHEHTSMRATSPDTYSKSPHHSTGLVEGQESLRNRATSFIDGRSSTRTSNTSMNQRSNTPIKTTVMKVDLNQIKRMKEDHNNTNLSCISQRRTSTASSPHPTGVRRDHSPPIESQLRRSQEFSDSEFGRLYLPQTHKQQKGYAGAPSNEAASLQVQRSPRGEDLLVTRLLRQTGGNHQIQAQKQLQSSVMQPPPPPPPPPPQPSQQVIASELIESEFERFLESKVFNVMDVDRDGLVSVLDVQIESLKTDILTAVQEFLFEMAEHTHSKYSFASFKAYLAVNISMKQQLYQIFQSKYKKLQSKGNRQLLTDSHREVAGQSVSYKQSTDQSELTNPQVVRRQQPLSHWSSYPNDDSQQTEQHHPYLPSSQTWFNSASSSASNTTNAVANPSHNAVDFSNFSFSEEPPHSQQPLSPSSSGAPFNAPLWSGQANSQIETSTQHYRPTFGTPSSSTFQVHYDQIDVVTAGVPATSTAQNIHPPIASGRYKSLVSQHNQSKKPR